MKWMSGAEPTRWIRLNKPIATHKRIELFFFSSSLLLLFACCLDYKHDDESGHLSKWQEKKKAVENPSVAKQTSIYL